MRFGCSLIGKGGYCLFWVFGDASKLASNFHIGLYKRNQLLKDPLLDIPGMLTHYSGHVDPPEWFC